MTTNAPSDNNAFACNSSIENFILIWLDADVNRTEENFNAQKELRTIINNIQTFEIIDQCEEYIKDQMNQYQFIVIVSGRLGQELVPRIHEFSQVLAIYVFCMDQEKNLAWARNFNKVE
ncbi:unnamed protein product [Rotaria sp. Silwood1]|nr:unnamed protein product [Rotaria sp. Silwood1]CAF1658684.1 unnamed protein product [Rotaria sp. Silwood1]